MTHIERSVADEAKNSETENRDEEKSEECKNFEHFARKIFAVSPSELEELQKKEREEQTDESTDSS